MTAIGYVRKENNGRYSGQLKTISIKADIDIVPNTNKTSDSQPYFRVLTQGTEIGAGWTKKGETSGKDYVSLSLAAPKIKPADSKLTHFLANSDMSDSSDNSH